MAWAYAISKLGWIREQQQMLAKQPRETPRQFIERESHYLWGRRYLMTVAYQAAKPSISLDHKRITLTVRPGPGHIRLNTELVKKPKDLLEPTHSDRFLVILEEHYPTWREARAELNELPLTVEVWKA